MFAIGPCGQRYFVKHSHVDRINTGGEISVQKNMALCEDMGCDRRENEVICFQDGVNCASLKASLVNLKICKNNRFLKGFETMLTLSHILRLLVYGSSALTLCDLGTAQLA